MQYGPLHDAYQQLLTGVKPLTYLEDLTGPDLQLLKKIVEDHVGALEFRTKQIITIVGKNAMITEPFRPSDDWKAASDVLTKINELMDGPTWEHIHLMKVLPSQISVALYYKYAVLGGKKSFTTTQNKWLESEARKLGIRGDYFRTTYMGFSHQKNRIKASSGEKRLAAFEIIASLLSRTPKALELIRRDRLALEQKMKR